MKRTLMRRRALVILLGGGRCPRCGCSCRPPARAGLGEGFSDRLVIADENLHLFNETQTGHSPLTKVGNKAWVICDGATKRGRGNAAAF